MSAQAALAELVNFYREQLSRSNNEYLRQRVDDVRDVVMRLTSHLSDALAEDSQVLPGPLIVVADEFLPSQAVMMGNHPVSGIVTRGGSQTSHAAIIARSRGIPAVSGVKGILTQVKTGDSIIVDGRGGHVLISPDAETKAAYLKLEREFVDLRDQLADNRDQPAKTACGLPIELLANINDVSGAKAAKAMGATGVGLVRTEYLYLTHTDVPNEQEQVTAYRSIIDTLPDLDITIRTLDIGGDKTVPFLGRNHNESNPFMGWRSIRLSFEHPDFFMTQIRAILRAAAKSNRRQKRVKILFPMVTNLEELRRLRAIVRRAEKQLRTRGFKFGSVEFGMMVEVPAAAVMMDQLAPEVDFVSVGSNDLVQYLMAADRDNPKVAHLCQPLSPAVLRTLELVIRNCREANVPVTVCGEMAGQPAAVVALLGMGLRRFSMSPSFVPTIKEIASHFTIEQCEAIWQKVQRERTTNRIQKLLNDAILETAPQLRPLIASS
jgi:phosphotransferase system enzyme I (PtsI)